MSIIDLFTWGHYYLEMSNHQSHNDQNSSVQNFYEGEILQEKYESLQTVAGAYNNKPDIWIEIEIQK